MSHFLSALIGAVSSLLLLKNRSRSLLVTASSIKRHVLILVVKSSRPYVKHREGALSVVGQQAKVLCHRITQPTSSGIIQPTKPELDKRIRCHPLEGETSEPAN